MSIRATRATRADGARTRAGILREAVSLASLDAGCAEPGTEVTVLWGEQPNSAKLHVEPHRQIAVRATVAPAPFVQYARENYRVA